MKEQLRFVCALLCAVLLPAADIRAQVTITGSNGVDGTYGSLTNAGGAFAQINSVSQAGFSPTITITADLNSELGSVGLNAPFAWTSLLITPQGNRIVSGTVAAGPLIDLNGAGKVTINGLNAGGNSLTISNLSTATTAGTSTIRFINDASNNLITNCTILGASASTLATAAGTILFSISIATGNDSNTVSNCEIGPATANTLPSKAIHSTGTFTTLAEHNSDNLIDSNNIYDFFLAANSCSGINMLSGNNNWTISNNRLYQTAPRTFTTTALRYSGITLNQSSVPRGSFTVTGNIIGFASSTQTGVTSISGSSNEFRGIDAVLVDTSVATSIQGNTISGITQSTSRASTTTTSSCFIGMMLGSTNGLFNVGTIQGNKIGSLDGSSTITINSSSTTIGTAPVIGIYNFSKYDSRINNNQIGSITLGGTGTVVGFRGIFVNTISSKYSEIMENEIANITDNQVGGYAIYGIVNSEPYCKIYKNRVRDLTGNSNLNLNVVMNGITVSGGAAPYTNLVEKNEVYNMSNTCNNVSLVHIHGYDLSFPPTDNIVRQNVAYKLNMNALTLSCRIIGIAKQGGNSTMYNNMVTLGYKPDGSLITIGFTILGIADFAGTESTSIYYYNTALVTGSAGGGGYNSTMYYTSAGVRELKNNIFITKRTGLLQNYAVRYAGSGPNPAGLTSDYNNFYSAGNVLGWYDLANRNTLAAWQTATGQDANSVSVDVSFVDEVNGNLRLTGPSIGDESLIGTPISGIDTDIDKNMRDALYPYMGAHEANVPLPVELTSFSYSVSQSDVTLNWTTGSEVNNARFEVERRSGADWVKAGMVNGNGTVSMPSNYTFTDRGLASGVYNYRLKQIDYNGSFSYFELRGNVSIGVPERFSLSQNYPNPFNPSTKISFDIPSGGFVSLKIYDISGREVASLVNEVKTAGYYTVDFNASNLSSGAYYYKLSLNSDGKNFTETKKMLLLK